MSVLNSFSTDARAAGAIGLTRIIQGHVHCQLVTHSAIQTIGAHGNNLHHVTGVGHQVLNDRPLVVRKKIILIDIQNLCYVGLIFKIHSLISDIQCPGLHQSSTPLQIHHRHGPADR